MTAAIISVAQASKQSCLEKIWNTVSYSIKCSSLAFSQNALLVLLVWMILHIICGLACHLYSRWGCDTKDDEKDTSVRWGWGVLSKLTFTKHWAPVYLRRIWTKKGILAKTYSRDWNGRLKMKVFSTAGRWLPISDFESKLGFLGAADKKAISRFSMISWQLDYFGDLKLAHQQICTTVYMALKYRQNETIFRSWMLFC